MFEDNYPTEKYDKFTHHKIIREISLSCCLGWHILRNCLGYAKNVNAISGRSSHEYDTNIFHSFQQVIRTVNLLMT